MSEASVGYLNYSEPAIVPLEAREWLANYDVARCYYCGEPAGTTDHVVPQSMLEALGVLGDGAVNDVLVRFGRRLTVPACLECNVVLNNSYQDTLAKRKAELKRRLKRRYKKILRTPDWTDRELSQLGERLQQAVIGAIVKRDVILRRLRY